MLVDSHAHLDMDDFDPDRPDIIKRAEAAGVERIVTIGIDVESSRKALEIALANEGVYAAVGIHPHNAASYGKHDIETIASIVSSSDKVVGWGEIGLDFNRNYAPRDEQVRLFESQLCLSHDLNLPIIIHDRDAHTEVLEILKRHPVGKRGGIIHCFSGDLELALTFIKMGFFISIPGTVTYKKAETVKTVAAQIPLERLLVETDAPFLAPVPMRGKRNEPAFVRYTATEIAHLRGIEPQALTEAASENAGRLFGIA